MLTMFAFFRCNPCILFYRDRIRYNRFTPLPAPEPDGFGVGPLVVGTDMVSPQAWGLGTSSDRCYSVRCFVIG